MVRGETKPDVFIGQMASDVSGQSGVLLSNRLNLHDTDKVQYLVHADASVNELTSGLEYYAGQIKNKLGAPWPRVLEERMTVAINTISLRSPDLEIEPDALATQLRTAFEAQLKLVAEVHDWINVAEESTVWALPVLLVVCRDLRTLAKRTARLADAGERIEQCMQLCIRLGYADPRLVSYGPWIQS